MANQPKKYTKFVATAATATLVASAIVPVASAASLSDISGNTHEEAINALVSEGIISGYQDGTFKPNKELTRSDVVKLLGKFLETKGYEAAADYKTRPAFADLTTKTNEELLKYASVVKEAGVFVGSNGNLLAGDPITRENMAITLVRTVNTVNDISLEEYVATQDFKGDVTDLTQAKAEARSAISVLDFYDITNPAAPAFNPKGNTTRGQFASFLYKTINADYTAAGQKDEEASSVLPTAITFEESSIQATYGSTVTLKAKVTVAEGESAANIPVKFDIFHEKLANDTTIVPQITETVKTDENGVATYTYTRSQGETDTVNAYATGKPALKAAAKVYWDTTLAVKDVTEATTLANGEQKVYQVSGEANGIVYITFKENLNVKPDTALRSVYVQGSFLTADGLIDRTTVDTANIGGAWLNPENSSQFTPYLLESGVYSSGYVKLDETGKANVVVTGKNAEVTPIVYTGAAKYSKTSLQATASKVKFEAESLYNLAVESLGSQNAAYFFNTEQHGGRDYKVTLKGKDGKVMPNAPVKVGFSKTEGTLDPAQIQVFANGELATKDSAGAYIVTTDGNGEVTFTVTGNLNNYATPIVFIGESLTDYEIQAKGNIVYFGGVTASNYTSLLKVTNRDDKEINTFGNGDTATFTYQLSDQNGKPRSYADGTNLQTAVTFTVRAGAKPVTVNHEGTDVTLKAYEAKSFTNYIAIAGTETSLDVRGEGASEVSVTATPTKSGLSGLTSVTKRVNFLAGASTSFFTISNANVNASETSIDSVKLTFTENVGKDDIFVNVNGATVTAESQTNNKVLYVYFNDAANKPAAENGSFTIAYKGKTYTVRTDSEGKLTISAQ